MILLVNITTIGLHGDRAAVLRMPDYRRDVRRWDFVGLCCSVRASGAVIRAGSIRRDELSLRERGLAPGLAIVWLIAYGIHHVRARRSRLRLARVRIQES